MLQRRRKHGKVLSRGESRSDMRVEAGSRSGKASVGLRLLSSWIFSSEGEPALDRVGGLEGPWVLFQEQ